MSYLNTVRQCFLLSLVAFGFSGCGKSDPAKSFGFGTIDPANSSKLSGTSVVSVQSAQAKDDRFECLLGNRSWFGTLKVEFRVTGQFDAENQLGRVRFARAGGSDRRYAVTQSEFPKDDANLFAFKAEREDGAAFYQSRIIVKNKAHTGSTDDFSLTDPVANGFYMAEYLWTDVLQGNSSKGTGVCYCPACGE